MAGRIVPRDDDDLWSAAALLARRFAADPTTATVRAEPPFPGATRGIERLGEGSRLVFACLLAHGDEALGVAFTTLVVGRPALIAVAPPSTPIPTGWTARRGED